MNVFDLIFEEEYKEGILRKKKEAVTTAATSNFTPENVIKNVAINKPGKQLSGKPKTKYK